MHHSLIRPLRWQAGGPLGSRHSSNFRPIGYVTQNMNVLAALKIAALLSVALLAAVPAVRDGGVIQNSGSTNFSGYTIKVWSDGSTWAVHSNRAGNPIDAPVTGSVAPELAQTFLHDAQQARKNRVISEHCMKSASFGTSTIVRYHGWTSPDLECPGGGFVVALAADAHKIAAQLKIQGLHGHRIPMLPNEPRRAPSDSPAGQASPTTEPSPSASY